MPRAVAQGLPFGVHRKSPGRPGCRAGVAQWLGTRLMGARAEGPSSIPPLVRFCENPKISILGSQNPQKYLF